MPTISNTYHSQFGEFSLGEGPENDFVWTGSIDAIGGLFSGNIPICIFTKKSLIPPVTIELMELIASDINQYLEKSVVFIKQTLTAQRDRYKIKEREYDLLSLDIKHFPVDRPELIFWQDSNEWMMRFAEGKFEICDPLGISVTYKLKDPISVDNLEDSEYIDP